MKTWVFYAAVSLGVVAGLAAVLSVVVDPASAVAVWVGAAVAWSIQLAAFAGLLVVRGRPERFIVAWGGGALLRFVLVALVGIWVTRARPLPPAPLLLSVAGFVVLLVMIEPVFLHRGTSRT